jgi:hypothetical protein
VSAFVTSVALYGDKTGPLQRLLATTQRIVAGQLGDSFRPYTLEQIHGTIIGLDGVADPSSGELVNQYFLELTGDRRSVNHRRAMEILADRLTPPMTIRFGGNRPDMPAAFASRGQHPFERSFSVQGDALVLMGWPIETVKNGDTTRPLDDLRRALNEAGFLHRYHRTPDDVDNDFYLVVGHHYKAPEEALRRTVELARVYLADHPVDVPVGTAQIRIVAADTATLARPSFVGALPINSEEFAALYQ